MRERRERAGGRWVWIGAAALLVLTPLAVWLGVFAPRTAKRARLEARLERSLADYHGQRWERPVLRGEPMQGNAHEAQREAIRDFGPIDAAAFDGLRELLERGGEPAAELARLIEAEREALASYRAAARREWAWGDAQPELGMTASYDWLPHHRAGRLLLASALARPARECFEICADALRLGQDRAAGTGLVPLMILAAHAEDVLVLGGRCLREADRDALEVAARELGLLARHPAPTGSAFEVEALWMGVLLRQEAQGGSSTLSGSGPDAWQHWWDVLEAWDLLMDDPASMRAIGDDYPTDIDRMERRQRDLTARDNSVLGIALPEYVRFLRRDAAARAIVRLLEAAARIRLEHDAPPDEAPALLSDRDRLDPTTGRPFAWTREGDEGTLSSRSTGALAHGELSVRVSWARPSAASVADLLAEQAEAEGQERDEDRGRHVDDREHGP